MPVGQKIIQNRINISELNENDIKKIQLWRDKLPWQHTGDAEEINTIRITAGDYPKETEISLGKFLSAIKNENRKIQEILFFALLCILESVSYTQKDGQFLRWDYRSGRGKGEYF